ncbi:MAG: sigma-54 dependent transcriptional regulator [Gammaproteobacteria bacterium]|jgi:DNA-binding NtrC family response regulator|nr:sigma-54 dependent transcriptional regulator [Gammaproteobacteria bacterium]
MTRYQDQTRAKNSNPGKSVRPSSSILIADDQSDVREALRLLLMRQGYVLMQASSPAEIKQQISTAAPTIVLLDMNYQRDTTSGQEGLELIEWIKQKHPDIAIIVMTAWGSIDLATQAMRAGASDFIEKPWDNNRLLSIIKVQCEVQQATRQSQKFQTIAELQRQHSDCEIVAESEPMRKVIDMLQQVASADASILLRGENGTGKNLLVEQIHAWSARARGPLVCVNMGSIPENLFESEIFGHVRGAFTDAREGRIGRFELADGGTLFLDEIGNLPLPQQAKLLRVLESGDYEKVGASKTQHSDVRIISASNAALETMVADHQFRKDLYYRLQIVEITIPALRDRRADIVPLARHFLDQHRRRYRKQIDGLSRTAEATLQAYDWPGNVRELAHVMERAVLLCSNSLLQPDDLALTRHDDPAASAPATTQHAELTLDQLERRHIQTMLQYCQGNIAATAKRLGISRAALYRRMEKHLLDG